LTLREKPGVAGSILEGMDEILTLVRLGLPKELRRSLARANIIENALGTVRRVSRTIMCWRNAEMGLRWIAPGHPEAKKIFRRLKVCPSNDRFSVTPCANSCGRDMPVVRWKPSERPHSKIRQRRLSRFFSTDNGTAPRNN
jgi:hypothetical protein